MKTNKRQNQEFVALLLILLLLLSFFTKRSDIRWLAVLMFFITLSLAFFRLDFFQPLRVAWIEFGNFLGRFTSPVFLFIFFFFIFTPLSLFIRIFKSNPFRWNEDRVESFWRKNEELASSWHDQF